MVRYKHCQGMLTFLLASMPKYMSLRCVQSTDKLMCRPLQHYTRRQINVFRRFHSQFSTDFHVILQGLFSCHPATTVKFLSENIV